jgi:ectoine hydroxylase-related dioxygenase (phytanoyl-CoA dioxygenase family)
MAAVSSDQVETFARDGVILLKGLVGEDWRRRLEAAIEDDLVHAPGYVHAIHSETGRYHMTSCRWPHDPDVRDYVFNSVLPGIAAELLQSAKVNLLYDQIFVKEPGTANRTPWHNDICVYPFTGRQALSFWLALDPVTKATGGLEYIRGSHLWTKNYQTDPKGFGRKEDTYPPLPGYEFMPDIDAARGDYDIVCWDMEPGDVLAFHVRTVHGADANSSSTRRRRAYSIRYTGDDVRYAPHAACLKPLVNPELNPGDPLDSDLFPVVWPK